MTATPPKPSLAKSTALAKTQSILQTLNTLLPTTTTLLSPVTVYTPTTDVAGLLFAPTDLLPNIAGFYGAWVAPDLNNGQPYEIQVECFGPGGGGGGGINNAGGGGGGGGEYACEPALTVYPNVSYTYCVGVSGAGGCNNSSAVGTGTAGSQTIFDLAGLTIPGGVVANPGQPGDAGSTGVGGQGGTGSVNTVVFPGGNGGTNQSGFGSDHAINLAKTSGMFAGNTKNANIIRAWYIYNDGPDSTFKFNDSSTYHNTAVVTVSGNGILIEKPGAPPQVPAYASDANPPNQPNPTQAGDCSLWNGQSNGVYAGYSQSPSFTFAGTKLTISCWLQCDPTGTWGNNAASATATVCANSKNYWTFNAFVGYGMFFFNTGTVSNPNWFLYVNWGNNTVANFVRVSMPPVVGTWYYVVATFNSGTITLYVNGTSVASGAAGFSSLPGAAYNTRVGTDPAGTYSYFFGYISNLWFASDAATSSLPTQAFGSTSPTGGAGGGATGSPGGAGNPGSSASGGTGGAGGTAVALPTSLAGIRSPGNNGMVGWNAGVGTQGSPNPGSGGGGGGDMAGSPASVTIQIPFATAATYCGIDATNAGAPYSSNQQTTTGTLFTGGLAGDSASGSKNTMLLFPAGIAKALGSNKWTIQQLSITFTNAQPTYATDTVLEFAYSSDTSLPQTYTGVSAIEYVGNALVPAGSNTVTYDLTAGTLIGELLNGTATALIFGPGDTPTFDAFNASTGAQFYNQIYGVGATDAFGNLLQPFITVVLQETLTTQVGGDGGVGAVVLSQITNAGSPVSIVQPYAGTDDQGNAYGAGYTGPVSAFTPGVSPTVVETWNYPSLNGAFISQSGSQKIGYRFEALNKVHIVGVLKINTGTSMAGTIFTVPAAYRPVATSYMPCAAFGIATSPAPTGSPYIVMDTSGNLTVVPNGTVSTGTAIVISCWYPLDGTPA